MSNLGLSDSQQPACHRPFYFPKAGVITQNQRRRTLPRRSSRHLSNALASNSQNVLNTTRVSTVLRLRLKLRLKLRAHGVMPLEYFLSDYAGHSMLPKHLQPQNTPPRNCTGRGGKKQRWLTTRQKPVNFCRSRRS